LYFISDLLHICLTDGTANTTSASGIVPMVQWYYNEIQASELPLAQEIGLV